MADAWIGWLLSGEYIAFDDAAGAATKAVRGKDTALAAEALRSLSEAALALADEIGSRD